MALPPNKQRSRRQRKKMRIGEFQEFGFEYELKVKAELSPAQEEALMDRFVRELLVPRNLAAAGWVRRRSTCAMWPPAGTTVSSRPDCTPGTWPPAR